MNCTYDESLVVVAIRFVEHCVSLYVLETRDYATFRAKNVMFYALIYR